MCILGYAYDFIQICKSHSLTEVKKPEKVPKNP